MRSKLEEAKLELLERAARASETDLLGGFLRTHPAEGNSPDRNTVFALLHHYYLRAAPEDLFDRDPIDVLGAVSSHWRLAGDRPEGEANVRVHTPTVEEDGWTSSYSIIETVTDDMPFLVDSVIHELTRQGRGRHNVVSPQIVVRRDANGELVDVLLDRTEANLPHDARTECWIHVEIDREDDPAELKQIAAGLLGVLSDVRRAVVDWERMRSAALLLADELPSGSRSGEPREQGMTEVSDLLRWLADDHFTFLGCRDYRLREGEPLTAVDGTGLGILRSNPQYEEDGNHPLSPSFEWLPPGHRTKAHGQRDLLVLTKVNSRATVHRPSYLDYIGVKTFDTAGNVTGERRFLGLFSSAAYSEAVRRIPVIRQKVPQVLEHAGVPVDSQAGRDLLRILETYPREELFHTPVEELQAIVTSVLDLQERRRLRLYLRRDSFGRYYSAIIYLPRDRYTSEVRLRIIDILREELGGTSVDFTIWSTESVLSRLHLVVRVAQGLELPEAADIDAVRIEERLVETAQTWADRFHYALEVECGEERAGALARKYSPAFAEGYKADHTPHTAVSDLLHLERLGEKEDFALNLYEPIGSAPGEYRLKIYRRDEPVSLSAVLPVLSRFGVEVTDERPYELHCSALTGWIYDFGLRMPPAADTSRRDRFQDAFAAVWTGRADDDDFNALVTHARITWREATVMRVYAKYWRQLGAVFSQESMAAALRNHPHATRLLASLFVARMSPVHQRAGVEVSDALLEELDHALEQVRSPDEARILRFFLSVINATLRTNFFQEETSGKTRECVSMKFDPHAIPDVPAPTPAYEIWVYSPRLEGTYLRFAHRVRGAPVWLERRDDFRAELLRLAEAQLVGDITAVPVGATGGFIAKQLPDPGTDRDAWLAEGIACYALFVSGLLDITDNLVTSEIVMPKGVVCHDSEDAYLLPSPDLQGRLPYDAAYAAYQEVASERGYWLRDTVAIPAPSTATITALGVWEAVRARFHELGCNVDQRPVSVVGTGSASGDVFSATLLSSPQARLLAAVDDEHIFLDPTPHADSLTERRRLAAIPGASWRDYDTSLISVGGGVHSRQSRRVPVSNEVRQLLALPDHTTRMSGHELAKAILEAPADLLLLGGHDVLLRTHAEQQAEYAEPGAVVRVDVAAIRAAVIGEAADGCVTSAAREAYALRGGRIGLPAVDAIARSMADDMRTNFAIVETALHPDGRLSPAAGKAPAVAPSEKAVSRAAFLHRLVALEGRQSHVGLAEHLRAAAVAPRGVFEAPEREEINRRHTDGRGLTLPALSVLLVQAHSALRDSALEAGLPPEDWKTELLEEYFTGLVDDDRDRAVSSHPLRDPIAASELAWKLVEELGPARPYSLAHMAVGGLTDVVTAFMTCRKVLSTIPVHQRRGDHVLTQPAETAVRLGRRRAVSGSLLWLLLQRPFEPYQRLTLTARHFSDVWAPYAHAVAGPSADDLLAIGVPRDEARKVWLLGCVGFACDARALAARTEEAPVEVARRYAQIIQRHHVTSAVAAGLAMLRSEESAARYTEALGSLRRDVILRVALDGPPGDGTWRNRAMESIFRTPAPATGTLAPEIATSLTGIQADLKHALKIPSTSRVTASTRHRTEQGNVMDSGHEVMP